MSVVVVVVAFDGGSCYSGDGGGGRGGGGCGGGGGGGGGGDGGGGLSRYAACMCTVVTCLDDISTARAVLDARTRRSNIKSPNSQPHG